MEFLEHQLSLSPPCYKTIHTVQLFRLLFEMHGVIFVRFLQVQPALGQGILVLK
jgi:hypothetical protein